MYNRYWCPILCRWKLASSSALDRTVICTTSLLNWTNYTVRTGRSTACMAVITFGASGTDVRTVLANCCVRTCTAMYAVRTYGWNCSVNICVIVCSSSEWNLASSARSVHTYACSGAHAWRTLDPHTVKLEYTSDQHLNFFAGTLRYIIW